jgi:hypothetical protein
MRLRDVVSGRAGGGRTVVHGSKRARAARQVEVANS